MPKTPIDQNLLKDVEVVVIDDDKELQRLIAMALSDHGIAPLFGSSGAEGLELALEHPRALFLFDYCLEDMQADELLDKLKERRMEVAFIIATAQGDERVAVEMMKRGARDYVTKDARFVETLPYVIFRAARDVARERELRDAEREIRIRDAKIRSIYKAAPIPIAHLVNRIVTDMNDSMCHLLGYEAHELLGKDIRLLYATREEYDRVGRSRIEQLRRAEIRAIETQWKRKDGALLDVLLSTTSISSDGATGASVVTVVDITERKRAEENLRLRDRAIQSVRNGIIITDCRQDGHPITFVNEAFEAITGYSAAEAHGKECHFLQGDDRNQPGAKTLRRAIDLGQPATAVLRNYRKDGAMFWNEVHVSPVRNSAGDVTHFVGVQNDITERIETEEALRESEERLRSFLNNVDDMVYTQALDGTRRQLNDANYRLTGYSTVDFERNPGLWEEIIHPEDLMLAKDFFERNPHGVETFDLEYRLRTKSGKWRWISSRMVAARDANGKITGFNCIDRDVTERKEAELERDRLFTAIEQSPDAVLITDTDGVINYVNPEFERVSGYRKEEVLGRNPRILKSGKQGPEFYAELWSTIEAGKTWSGQIVNRSKSGRFYTVAATISPVRDRGKTVAYVSVLRDITDELKRRERMRQHHKLEAIGTLAGGIAHDFNNVLQGVIGYTELSLSRMAKDDPNAGYLREVLSAGNRAGDLIRQILTFSRQAEQERRPIDLTIIVKEVLKLIRGSIPSTVTIRQKIGSDCPPIMADPIQIHQIVMNLCTNAFQAMDDAGGTLAITVEPVDVAVEEAESIPGIKPGKHVCLSVADDGCGMDEEALERIFEPYFTTKGRSGGTGLGLPVVHGIIQTHEAAITVESEVGKGTEFTIYFPACPMEPSRDTPAAQTGMAFGGTERILLVDDEPAIAEVARLGLGKMGYRVASFTDSREAFAIFKKSPEAFDLLITDLTMPGMTGLQLIQQVHKVRPGLPVILCSGFSEAADLRTRSGLDIRRFLMKPIILSDLAKMIRQVMAETKQGGT